MMKRLLVVANWKMDPAKRADARAILLETKEAARALSNTSVVVCPPFVYLAEAGEIVRTGGNLELGAQDVFWEMRGARTGEISPAMLVNLGAQYVIVGHSERRALGETDAMVAEKTRAALAAGLSPIVCVGESVRDENGEYATRVRDEIEQSLSLVSKTKLSRLVIAYEPIWAIGEHASGAAHPALIREMGIYIRRVLVGMFGRSGGESVPILYGGSVDHKNAASFIADARMNGLLVGRASLKPKSFTKILAAVDAL